MKDKLVIVSLLAILLQFFFFKYTHGRAIQLRKRAFSYIANETVCIVDDILYHDGDPIPTDDPCEHCKCRPPGFSCVLRECEMKPGCKAIRREGECCPEYQCGCEHSGKFYEDGERIPIIESPCYTCYCHGSSITCALADCKFRFDCEPEYIVGECCPRYNNCPTETPPTRSTIWGIKQQNFAFTTPLTTIATAATTLASPIYLTRVTTTAATTTTPASTTENIPVTTVKSSTASPALTITTTPMPPTFTTVPPTTTSMSPITTTVESAPTTTTHTPITENNPVTETATTLTSASASTLASIFALITTTPSTLKIETTNGSTTTSKSLMETTTVMVESTKETDKPGVSVTETNSNEPEKPIEKELTTHAALKVENIEQSMTTTKPKKANNDDEDKSIEMTTTGSKGLPDDTEAPKLLKEFTLPEQPTVVETFTTISDDESKLHTEPKKSESITTQQPFLSSSTFPITTTVTPNTSSSTTQPYTTTASPTLTTLNFISTHAPMQPAVTEKRIVSDENETDSKDKTDDIPPTEIPLPERTTIVTKNLIINENNESMNGQPTEIIIVKDSLANETKSNITEESKESRTQSNKNIEITTAVNLNESESKNIGENDEIIDKQVNKISENGNKEKEIELTVLSTPDESKLNDRLNNQSKSNEIKSETEKVTISIRDDDIDEVVDKKENQPLSSSPSSTTELNLDHSNDGLSTISSLVNKNRDKSDENTFIEATTNSSPTDLI